MGQKKKWEKKNCQTNVSPQNRIDFWLGEKGEAEGMFC